MANKRQRVDLADRLSHLPTDLEFYALDYLDFRSLGQLFRCSKWFLGFCTRELKVGKRPDSKMFTSGWAYGLARANLYMPRDIANFAFRQHGFDSSRETYFLRYVYTTIIRNSSTDILNYTKFFINNVSVEPQRFALLLVGARVERTNDLEYDYDQDSQERHGDAVCPYPRISVANASLFDKTMTPRILDAYLSRYPLALTPKLVMACFICIPEYCPLVMPILEKVYKGICERNQEMYDGVVDAPLQTSRPVVIKSKQKIPSLGDLVIHYLISRPAKEIFSFFEDHSPLDIALDSECYDVARLFMDMFLNEGTKTVMWQLFIKNIAFNNTRADALVKLRNEYFESKC
jgi:hypothetical protein